MNRFTRAIRLHCFFSSAWRSRQRRDTSNEGSWRLHVDLAVVQAAWTMGVRSAARRLPLGETSMRPFLLAVGVLLVVLGLHWIGQGTGVFVWPANPVMDDHIEWAYYGGGAGIAGVLLIWFSRRRATAR
jgi:hypothetical protein